MTKDNLGFDTNRRDEKEKGLLAWLLALLGSGGSGTATGVGGFGALLSTKAGIIGLVFAGTTVAAGIGVLGTRVMRSPKPAPQVGANFFQQSQNQDLDDLQPAGTVEGESAGSLEMMAGAEGEYSYSGKRGGKESPVSSVSTAKKAVSAARKTPPPAKKTTAASSATSFKGLTGGKSLGNVGGMSGGIGAKFSAPYRSDSLKKSPSAIKKPGSLSGHHRDRSPTSVRKISGKRGRTGRSAGMQLNKAQSTGRFGAGAPTGESASYSAGTVFDGTGDGGEATGGKGTKLGGGGIGQGDMIPNTEIGNKSQIEPPVPPKAKEAETEWKKTLKTMLYCLLGAFVALLIGGWLAKQTPWGTIPAYICAAAAAAAGGYIIYLAYTELIQKHNQTMMGIMWIVMGAIIIQRAWEAISTASGEATKAEVTKAASSHGEVMEMKLLENGNWAATYDTNTTKVFTKTDGAWGPVVVAD